MDLKPLINPGKKTVNIAKENKTGNIYNFGRNQQLLQYSSSMESFPVCGSTKQIRQHLIATEIFNSHGNTQKKGKNQWPRQQLLNTTTVTSYGRIQQPWKNSIATVASNIHSSAEQPPNHTLIKTKSASYGSS